MYNFGNNTDRLKTHLANNMLEKGEITYEKHHSIQYTGVDYYRVMYRGTEWMIIFVDGMACQIEKNNN